MKKVCVLLLALCVLAGCSSRQVGIEFVDPITGKVNGTSVNAKQLHEWGYNSVRCHLRRDLPNGAYEHPYSYINGKYDLTKFNEVWLDAVKANIKKNKKYGIITTIELFNRSEFKGTYDSKRYCPYYAKNNVNGYVNSNFGNISTQVFTIGGRIAETAKRLAEKMAGLLKDYHNDVVIQLCNEPEGGQQIEWHRMMLKALKDAGWKGGTVINPPANADAATIKAFASLKPTYLEVHTTNIATAKAWLKWIDGKCGLIVSTDTGAKDFAAVQAIIEWCIKNNIPVRFWNFDGDINKIKEIGKTR